MQALLEQLCRLPGPSSDEGPVRNFLREAAAPFIDDCREDALGNLILFKKGKATATQSLMLCAHMDEVGLMVKRVTDEGFVKFTTLGGIDRRVLLGKRVLIGTARTPGVIGLAAYHLGEGKERSATPKLSDLLIDIGASKREEAEALVELGDSIVFADELRAFGKGLLRAKALDDRVGCAILLRLLQEELPLDCHFVFTVQEEVGTRGAFGAAFSLAPQHALVIEGTTAADLGDAKEHEWVCHLGGGPVLPFMDRATIYDRAHFELLRDLAKNHEIPWQTKQRVAGGTDAGAIQRSRAGVRVAGISAPVRYLHTPNSLICLEDAENMLRLARLFLAALAKNEEGALA